MAVTKLILALCLSTKVAGFASYSGKDCILAESCPPAGSVDGFACSVFPNCQDPNFTPTGPTSGTGCPPVNPAIVPGFTGPFARFADNEGSPWIYDCSDNTCASCAPFLPAATFAAVLSIEDPFASCAADPAGSRKGILSIIARRRKSSGATGGP